MKFKREIGILLLAFLCGPAQGALYHFDSSSSAPVPDGDRNGLQDTRTLTGIPSMITDVRVTLNISGGFNGDLYAYLNHNGTIVPLLNRVGVGGSDAFGYGGSGMNITLADGGSDIHGVSNPTLNEIYAPDGRDIGPLSSPTSFDTASRVTLDGSFGGTDPNGNWTLFFADVSSGGGQSTVVGWSLDIVVVPEPINVALGVFGGLFLAGTLCGNERVQKLFIKARAR